MRKGFSPEFMTKVALAAQKGRDDFWQSYQKRYEVCMTLDW